MENNHFFESVEFLEKPRCPDCDAELVYGVTTRYDDKRQFHVCNKCGCFLKD